MDSILDRFIERVNPDGSTGRIIVGDGTKIAPTAKVRDFANIGKNVKVAGLGYIGRDSEIGDDSDIGFAATIHFGAKLGKRVIVKKFGVVQPRANVPDGTIIEEGEIYQ